MNRWNEWTRTRDGWVERKRRFQKMFGEKILRVVNPKARAVAVATVPASPVTAPHRDEK